MPAPSAEADVLSTFVKLLETLETSIQVANVNCRSLLQQFLQAQQFYQTQLLPTLLASPSAEGLVTYQTEINRALRLLGMDVSFLQSAKNAVTLQKRQAQMRQRLNTLLEFCRGLQGAIAPGE